MFATRKRANRRGIATAECALCLPVIVTLTLGVIETCSVLFLKETVTIAAYEGARVGIMRGGTNSVAQTRIQEVLDGRNINYGNSPVTFSDPDFDDAQQLEHVTTTVTVPCAGNTVIGWFFTGRNVDASVTLRKEFTNP